MALGGAGQLVVREVKRLPRAVRIVLVLLLLAVAVLAGVRLWPHPSLREAIPVSTAVYAADGRLLRLTLAADEQYRVWTALEDVSPVFIEALLLHEDRQFRHHPGVNPAALLRAAHVTLAGGARQGGSTITMQLARLFYRLNTRNVAGKVQQILAALWLEARYPKQELLEAHVNLLPYGGNVQGVGAASLFYFGKQAADLTLAEALTLVLVPQSPRARAPGDNGEPPALRAARERLLARWLAENRQAGPAAQLAALPPHFIGGDSLPFIAPHVTTALLARPHEAVINTTLDIDLQRLLERRIGQYLATRSGMGLRNASALLVDYRDMSVRALVGSADFKDASIHGQVNGAQAKRSPGSTLKPFIYALAFDQGLVHPRTVLKDAPTSFGPFAPENFDGAFVGPITAHDALIRSRNVPAVSLAARLAQPSLYQFLRGAGVSRMASERHYGLALALGGGELTMEELATLYAALANGGRLRPLRYRLDDPQRDGTPLLSAEASFLVLDILADNPRPDMPDAMSVSAPRVAWKTGTSWGFRDAWTAGVFGPYVLVVWVGNFDGLGDPAFVGVTAAAPLFLQIADAIRAGAPGADAAAFRRPKSLVRVEVCAASGELPNADCPQTTSTWFIPGRSPIRVSDVHRRLRIDLRTGRQACADTPQRFVREEVYEFWPSDILRLYEQAGLPRRRPPAESPCEAGGHREGRAPQITSPLTAVTYPVRAVRLGTETIPLSANADADVRTLYWFVDGAYVGTGRPGVSFAWVPDRAGAMEVSAVDEYGRSDTRRLDITLLPQ